MFKNKYLICNMSILTAFNNIVIDFVDDCISVFPSDNDFKTYKNALILLKKYNPRKIIDTFKEYLKIYREPLESKNEQFFLDNSFKEVEKYNNEEIFQVINRIKKYWKNLNDVNKNKIWDYIDILIQLSDKV